MDVPKTPPSRTRPGLRGGGNARSKLFWGHFKRITASVSHQGAFVMARGSAGVASRIGAVGLGLLLAACAGQGRGMLESDLQHIGAFARASTAQAAREQLISGGAQVSGLRFLDGQWTFRSSVDPSESLSFDTRARVSASAASVMDCDTWSNQEGTAGSTQCDLASEAQDGRQALIDCECGYTVSDLQYDSPNGEWYFTWDYRPMPEP